MVEMDPDLEDFLDAKGAVGVICFVGGNKPSFTELDDNLGISPGTLRDRLTEARELELVEKALTSTNTSAQHKYVLTDEGKELHHEFRERNMCRIYRDMTTLQADLEEAIESVKEGREPNTASWGTSPRR